MREVKFRGLTAKGEMAYGYLVQDKEGTTAYWNDYSQRVCWYPESGGSTNIPVKNGTVGQFTGLKDKDGVDIYEGDILLCYPDDACTSYLKVVEWDNNKCELGITTNSRSGVILCKGASSDYAVYGNIHQNPELIEA